MRLLLASEELSQSMLKDALRGLVMGLGKYKLGELIQIHDERNVELAYGLNDVKGISIQKNLLKLKQICLESRLNRIFSKARLFCLCNRDITNGEKITIAHNNTNNTYIISSSYIVFRVKRTDLLLPDYLFMYFKRSEFDRYARYNSWGSARETFSWEEMCDIDIELPDIAIQQNTLTSTMPCWKINAAMKVHWRIKISL